MIKNILKQLVVRLFWPNVHRLCENLNEIGLVALTLPLGPQNESNIHTDTFIKNLLVSEDLKMDSSAENSKSNSLMIKLMISPHLV